MLLACVSTVFAFVSWFEWRCFCVGGVVVYAVTCMVWSCLFECVWFVVCFFHVFVDCFVCVCRACVCVLVVVFVGVCFWCVCRVLVVVVVCVCVCLFLLMLCLFFGVVCACGCCCCFWERGDRCL